MAKCSICGKRGIFLKTDKYGRCSACANKTANRTLTAEELVERVHPEFKKTKSDLEHQEKLLASVWEAREQYKTDNETTSLAIGYNLPNMRSEVFELIEDIHNSFNFNICVLSFTDLLVMAVSVINSGKEISIQHFRTLKGVYNVKKLNNN